MKQVPLFCGCRRVVRLSLGMSWLIIPMLGPACADDGANGADGAQGPPGDDGERGSRGPEGDPGETGQTGAVGPSGQAGPDGGLGPAGPAGTDLRFTGEGLVLSIEAARIDNGVGSVDFLITDELGNPLDRQGITTAGPVSTSFILSWLDEDDAGEPTTYHAYTTREQTTPDTETSAVQSATDSDGVYEALGGGEGRYRYTFGTEIDIPDGAEDNTHTVGIYSTRTASDVRHVANELYSFVPSGDEPSTFLDVVTDQACNNCHTQVEAHGGARRGVDMCLLCHTESNDIDPDTNNSFDFEVMIHKIHMGARLPSVQAGVPYQIVGYRQSVHDYSDVHYPGIIENCANCHQGSQGDRWQTALSQKRCESCHDRSYFESGALPDDTWEIHAGGPRDDSECIVCHASDSLSSITFKHQNELTDPDRVDLQIEIVSIEDTAPGQSPEIVLRAEANGLPVDIITNPLNRLRLYIAGPNTDYVERWSEDLVGVAECDDVPVPPCLEVEGANFRYYAENTIPADATGSYTLGIEARVIPEVTRYFAPNALMAFAVTDSEAVPRREIVSLERCNSCHEELSFHGGNRRDPEMCALCHSPGLADAPLPAVGGTTVSETFNFKEMIHRIHAETHYPDKLSNCSHCHVEGSTALPLPRGNLPTVLETHTCTSPLDAGACDTVDVATSALGAATGACTSCHAAPETAAHAEVNTSPTTAVEACSTCHGSQRDYDVQLVHAP